MKITVIGATGNIGSCAAFNICSHRLADELVLIDNPLPDRLAMHALDLTAAVTGKDMEVRGGKDEDMAGSDIVVIAAGSAQTVTSRLEVLPNNLPIIREIGKNIVKYCPGAIVITATNPVCPLNYGMYRCTGIDRSKSLGYSFNDTMRFRMRVAQLVGVPSSKVEGLVMGEHGDSQVALFSTVRVEGKKVTIGEGDKQKIRDQVPAYQKVLEDLRAKTGRTAAWTTAVGLVELIRAIVKDSGETIPCSVVLDGEYGYKGLSISVPVVVGRGGVKQVVELKLAEEEKEGFRKSVEVLLPFMKYVEEH